MHSLNNHADVNIAIPEGMGLECRKIAELCSKYKARITVIKKDVGDLFREKPLCILVDVASLEQVKVVKNHLESCNSIAVIDHHESHSYETIFEKSGYFLQIVNPRLSSSSEIVFEISKYLGIRLPKDILEMIMAGIIWDTKRFLRSTSSTFRNASELLEQGADYQVSQNLVTISKPPYVRLAKIKCILRHRGYRITLGSHDIYIAMSEVGAYESECASMLISTGYDIAFVATEEEALNSTRIIYRVREDPALLQRMDIYNHVLKQLIMKYGGGGGGHKTAGGAVINSPNTELVLRDLIKILGDLAEGKIVELAEQKVLEG